MPNKTDYLYATARIRSLEQGLLTRERMEAMLGARSTEDALKVLAECGYGELSVGAPADIEAALAARRLEVYQLAENLAADKELLNVLRIKYDFHNIKALVKGEEARTASLLIDAGTVPAEELKRILREGELYKLPGRVGAAVEEARDVLARTKDPQLADFILDKAAFARMAEAAKVSGSDFIMGYVAFLADGYNLRAFIRSRRMEKSAEFFARAAVEGGSVSPEALGAALEDGAATAEGLFWGTPLSYAAALGDAALQEGGLTRFEKACDDAVTEYLKKAKYIPFGEEPLFAFVAAKENEFTAVRTILSGRLANLCADTIRERLRESYV